jgi:hypothetical protein
MVDRCLAIAAPVWAAGFLAVYLAVVHGQGNSPAWWYVALVAAGAFLMALPRAGRRARARLILGAVLLGLAALAGVLSIGLLLAPAVVLAALAAARLPGRDEAGQEPAGPSATVIS